MSSPLLLAFFLLIFTMLISPTISNSEKKADLSFYFHDIVVGTPPTAVRVAQSPHTDTSPTGFGAVVMIDDRLTEEPDPSSKLVGYAQGIYALASKEEFGLMMVMNLHFVNAEYNGSTLAVLGRNAVSEDVREMPVIGGTGKFRFARGYALARTHEFNLTTGNAIVEYNVLVLHH